MTTAEFVADESRRRKGFRYAPRSYDLNTAEESRLMALCGSTPETFGGCVDPATFITHAIEEGTRNGISANGGVNMVQWLIVHDLPKIDEAVTVTGEVLDVQDAPRGKITTSEVWYHRANGNLGVTSGRTSLKTDPTKYADPKLRGAGERPAPIIEDPSVLEVVETAQLTPEIVLQYSQSTLNPVHTDMDAANRAGYRAPIIGGAHGVRFLTRAIWDRFAPSSVRMDIRFRRPIFWDDAFEVRVAGDGAWDAICLARDGKVLVEMAITDLVPTR